MFLLLEEVSAKSAQVAGKSGDRDNIAMSESEGETPSRIEDVLRIRQFTYYIVTLSEKEFYE